MRCIAPHRCPQLTLTVSGTVKVATLSMICCTAPACIKPLRLPGRSVMQVQFRESRGDKPIYVACAIHQSRQIKLIGLALLTCDHVHITNLCIDFKQQLVMNLSYKADRTSFTCNPDTLPLIHTLIDTLIAKSCCSC